MAAGPQPSWVDLVPSLVRIGMALVIGLGAVVAAGYTVSGTVEKINLIPDLQHTATEYVAQYNRDMREQIRLLRILCREQAKSQVTRNSCDDARAYDYGAGQLR